MGAARESANIWSAVTSRYTNGGWQGWRLLNKRFWRSPYLIQDSFLTYWHRLFTCRLFGHIKLQNVSDPGEPPHMFCFRCYRYSGDEESK